MVNDSPRSPAPRRPVRIANASGFLGDRSSALREAVQLGEVDVVTGDYLAELTMMILGKQRAKNPGGGYAATFLAQLAPVLGEVLSRGIKIVVNAGGLNPSGLADAVRALGAKSGLEPKVASLHGDDLRPRLEQLLAEGHTLRNLETEAELTPADLPTVLTANAYLGGWGIVRALQEGADIVICPRVTDASLVVGAAAWWHDWARDDWDALAGAVAAGHVIECGPQATGGNYSSFQEIADLTRPGFPIAEVAVDGSSVITKHAGTGGAVTVGTVTAQLVYEIGSTRYLNPDVTTLLDTIELEQRGTDRVALRGTRGAPPPASTKVAITTRGLFRNEMSLAFVGLDIDAKMDLFERTTRAAVTGCDLYFQRIGTAKVDAARQDDATALLRVVASGSDEAAVSRGFTTALVEQGLSSYPGLFVLGVPGGASEVGGYWPALLPQELLAHEVVHADGRREAIPLPPTMRSAPPAAEEPEVSKSHGPVRRAPLGELFDARSGDKGSDANVGVWARDEAAFAWLCAELDVARFRELVPESKGHVVERYVLPKLRALNFVLRGYLAGGAAASPKLDRQGKALGELLRARQVELPVALLDARANRASATVIPSGGPSVAPRKVEAPTVMPGADDAAPTVVRCHVDQGIARITLDSPENRNALSVALLDQLYAALNQVTRDEDLRAIVLAATGTTFCSGADLKAPPSTALTRAARMVEVIDALGTCRVPVVVQLNGVVRAGGLGLLGAADIVIAPDTASFAFTEVRIGVVPAVISVPLLPRMTARGAQRYFLTGEAFDAAEAVRVGLVTESVPADQVEAHVESILDGFRASAPSALAITKSLLRELAGKPASLENLHYAAKLSARVFTSDDAREGMAAFRERRPPRWAAAAKRAPSR